jgi:hypothetical protein
LVVAVAAVFFAFLFGIVCALLQVLCPCGRVVDGRKCITTAGTLQG